MIRGVHHVSISTRNMDRLLGFYRDLLGLSVVLDGKITDNPLFDNVVGLKNSRAHGVFLQAGNAFLEFWEYEHPVGKDPIENRPVCDAGVTHICFDVADAQAAYDTLSAAGVFFESPPQDLGTVITCYARDPDGNLLELRQGVPPSTLELTPAVMAAARSNLAS